MRVKEENTYRNILKGISLFGSVQMLQILINVTRGKFVAYLLGPSGMGVSSLFASSSLTLQRFSSLGLNLAIVKEVAAASDDRRNLATILSVARRLITFTAVLAALVCVVFSHWLSILTFGDPSMQWQFMLLGIAVGLSVAYTGHLSVLQGFHDVKNISRASLVGGVTGLVAGVPLYYLFGTRGIVPAMIILAATLFIFYRRVLTRPQYSMEREPFSWSRHRPIIKRLLLMGMLLMSNDLLQSLSQYLINIYINSTGSTDAVGLYQAANSVTAQYAGIVFAVMAMDYFPRLSKSVGDNDEMRDVVNRQFIVTALIIGPSSGLLIISSPFLIRVLLSPEFLPVTELMRWMGLGIMFRALMTPLGYISFAKGNKKLFFWMEGVGCNLLTLSLSCGFFHFFGLTGLGYSLVADNALCLIIYYIVNRKLYSFRFSRQSMMMMAMAVIATSSVFLASFIPATAGYAVMTSILIISGIYSLKRLRRLALI